MMKNGKTKGNVFVLDEYLLNEEGTKVLKTILQYMDVSDTADKDILLFYITNKLGISSYTLKNFTDEASVRKFLFGQSKYKGNNDSIEKAISKFVEDNFNIDKILASCKYDANTKSAVIYKKYGLKKTLYNEIFYMDEMNTMQNFDNFAQQFANIYLRKYFEVNGIKNCKMDDFDIKVSKVYNNGRFWNIDVEVQIPMETLSTNVLGKTVDIFRKADKVFDLVTNIQKIN